MWNHFSFISVHNLEMDNPFLAKIPLMDFERTPPIFNCVLKKKTQKFKKKKPRCYIFDFKPLYKSANYLWCCTSSLETEYLVMFSSGSHVNWYCWTVKLHVFLFLFSFAKWAKYRFREIMFEKNLWLPFNVHCARVNTYIIKGTVFP